MTLARPWSALAGGIALTVRLTPKGGRDAIDGIKVLGDGRPVLKARVRAAPSEGEANDALCRLIAFNVVNTRNQVVAMITDMLYRLTEPLLRPIRSMLPNLGGIDVSPVILILLILFLENVIIRYIYPNVF